MWASYAYVGLSAPGGVGSWQREAKVNFTALLFVYTMIQLNVESGFQFFFLLDRFQGYQFWVQADEEGRFLIENIRAGHYNLYAWVPGIVGDCRYDAIIYIQPGTSEGHCEENVQLEHKVIHFISPQFINMLKDFDHKLLVNLLIIKTIHVFFYFLC